MFFVEIPIAVILILALCVVGLGWNIIANIDKIVETIGLGIVAIIIAAIVIFFIYAICNLICRKKPIPTIILFLCSLILLVYGIVVLCNYQYSRYDAFYTIEEVIETDYFDGQSISYVIPAGSLVSGVSRNTHVKMYRGIDSIPASLECKYVLQDGKEVVVDIKKDNLRKCGWIDYFGNLHKEENG